MLNYTDLSMNLFISDDENDEDVYYLSAYGRDEYDELDTSNYITVEIASSDYRCFTSDGDWWCNSGAPEFENLLSTFILYQLNEKATNG